MTDNLSLSIKSGCLNSPKPDVPTSDRMGNVKKMVGPQQQLNAKPKNKSLGKNESSKDLATTVKDMGLVPTGMTPRRLLPGYNAHKTEGRESIIYANKIKLIENMYRKMQNTQNEFMNKVENLRALKPEKMREEYKFVTLVLNDDSQLVLKQSNEKPQVAKILSDRSITELKKHFKEALENMAFVITELVKHVNLYEKFDKDHLMERLKGEMDRIQILEMDEFNNSINKYRVEEEVKMEILNQTTSLKKELLEKTKALQLAEKKMDFIEFNAKEMELLKHELRIHAQTSLEKDRKIQSLQKRLTNYPNSFNCDQIQTKVDTLSNEIKTSRGNTRTLKRQLIKAQNELSCEREQNKTLSTCLHKLESDLETAYTQLNLLKTETIKSSININNLIGGLNDKMNILEEKIDCITNIPLPNTENKNLDVTVNKRKNGKSKTLLSQSKICKYKLTRASRNIAKLEARVRMDNRLLNIAKYKSQKNLKNNNRLLMKTPTPKVDIEPKASSESIAALNDELLAKTKECNALHSSLNQKLTEIARLEHLKNLLEGTCRDPTEIEKYFQQPNSARKRRQIDKKKTLDE